MAKTRTMTRNQNHDDDDNASKRKRFKTCDNDGVAPWSDLNHDVLCLVIMELGVVDFLSFSKVCKSWRSLALSNWFKFMTHRPPMSLCISRIANEKECYLEDFEGRKFKTIIPHSAGMNCVGLTCGYLILWRKETNDILLVNPITRHQLHFPYAPDTHSWWVFVMVNRLTHEIWFSVAGKGAWNNVSPTFPILSLRSFKGKIYALLKDCSFCEFRLHPEPKLMLIDTTNVPKPASSLLGFVSHPDNLYGMQFVPHSGSKLHKLDFDEMKWVWQEKALRQYELFHSHFRYWICIEPDSWADHTGIQYEIYAFLADTRNRRIRYADSWSCWENIRCLSGYNREGCIIICFVFCVLQ